MQRIKGFFDRHPTVGGYVMCLLLGFVTTVVVEIIARRSFVSFFGFVMGAFIPFIYNCFIVFLMLCVARLFKRRAFAYTLVCVIWLTLAVINAILQFLRPTPLTASDFIMFLSAYEITKSYLTFFQIVAVIAVSVALVIGMVYLFHKIKKEKPQYKKELIALAAVTTVFTLISIVGNATGVLAIKFNNISTAYDDYGFEYCFCSTVFRKGITKPAGHSKQAVNEILAGLIDSNEKVVDDGSLPNIVFVQLESFFDLEYYDEYSANCDATPNFTILKERFPNGLLQVPVFGGGTANTEFEILSGMRIAYFSGGEIPFETVLKKGTCESIAFNLKEYGYYSTALHNHTGTFYDRHEVYANLGFDRFIPSEYMQGIEYTPVGWEKDRVLTKYIMESMKQTPQKDFVFAVSVQGHGGYPKADEDFNLPLTLSNDDGSEQAFATRYYANQLFEMDEFVGELVVALEQFDEKTVVVFYGDHLPALNLSDSKLNTITTYQTEYVVYSNFDLDFQAPDGVLLANRLAGEVMKSVGINNGYIMQFNQENPDSNEYRSKLNILQYELLYGESFAEYRKRPPTELNIGLYPVVIKEVSFEDGRLSVICENSTYNSVIFVNGKKCFTKYFSETHIVTDEATDIKPGDVITVCQETNGGDVLGTSDPVMFQ